MNESAMRSIERGLAWCGPIFIVTFIYGFGYLGHNYPPPNMMAMSSLELVNDFYLPNPLISVGMIMCATFGLFYMAWSCLLASLLRNQDGSLSALSLIELAGGTLTGWLLAFCPAIWAACAMMAGELDPDVIKMAHVMTWYIFDCTYMITTFQMLGLGLYTVLNKRQTMFPEWAGWICIAIGVAFMTLVFMPFATEGPFSVSGMWNFWIIFTAWLILFFGVYNYYVLRHLYSTPGEQERASGVVRPAMAAA
jgi:hypothetical protein